MPDPPPLVWVHVGLLSPPTPPPVAPVGAGDVDGEGGAAEPGRAIDGDGDGDGDGGSAKQSEPPQPSDDVAESESPPGSGGDPPSARGDGVEQSEESEESLPPGLALTQHGVVSCALPGLNPADPTPIASPPSPAALARRAADGAGVEAKGRWHALVCLFPSLLSVLDTANCFASACKASLLPAAAAAAGGVAPGARRGKAGRGAGEASEDGDSALGEEAGQAGPLRTGLTSWHRPLLFCIPGGSESRARDACGWLRLWCCRALCRRGARVPLPLRAGQPARGRAMRC